MWTFWSDLLREWENRKITIQEESCDRVKGKESLSEGIFQCHVSPWAQKWDWQVTESSTFSAYVTARQSLLGASYHQGSLRKEGRKKWACPNISGNNAQNQWDSTFSLVGHWTCYRNSQTHRRAHPSESERLHEWVFQILQLTTTAPCSTVSTHGPLPKDVLSTIHRQEGLQDQGSTPLIRKWRILAMKDLPSKILMPKKCHCHWADHLLG